VVNIVGDLVLIGLFHMNVAGAAIATVFAQAVSVILSLFIIRRQELPFVFKKEYIGFNEETVRIIKVGFPMALQEILTNVSFLVLCSVINALGVEASAGYGVANKVVSFILLIPSSLWQTMSAFVAQNVGAGKEKRARKALASGMAVGCAIGVVIFLLALLKGEIFIQLFSSDPAVIEKGAEYLRGFSLEPIVTAVLFSFMGYYNGHGRTVWVMIQGLAQSILVRLPMSIIMSSLPNTNLTLIGLAAPAATIFGIVLNVIYFIYYGKQLKKANL
jgi:Na+-driven multidrug efflux pump